MKKNLSLLVLFFIIAVRVTQAQTTEEKSPVIFDSLPSLKYVLQTLSTVEQIRCVVSLFVRHFHVSEENEFIEVTLYEDSTNYMVNEALFNNCTSIFQVAYSCALDKHIEYFKSLYQKMVIKVCNHKGVLQFTNEYPIKKYNFNEPTLETMDIFLKKLRVPCNWTVKENKFETYFYCVDSLDRRDFHKILLNVLYSLNLLNHNWKEWIGYYVGCTDKQKVFAYTVKLNL